MVSTTRHDEDEVLRISFKSDRSTKCASASGDVLEDPKYNRKSADLIREVLMDNGSILQLNDGSILVTKTTLVTVMYKWDSVKQKFIRVKSGGHLDKRHSRSTQSTAMREPKQGRRTQTREEEEVVDVREEELVEA